MMVNDLDLDLRIYFSFLHPRVAVLTILKFLCLTLRNNGFYFVTVIK